MKKLAIISQCFLEGGRGWQWRWQWRRYWWWRHSRWRGWWWRQWRHPWRWWAFPFRSMRCNQFWSVAEFIDPVRELKLALTLVQGLWIRLLKW